MRALLAWWALPVYALVEGELKEKDLTPDGGEKFVIAYAAEVPGLVAVGNVDNLIRPYVYRRWAQIHPFITVIGAFASYLAWM